MFKRVIAGAAALVVLVGCAQDPAEEAQVAQTTDAPVPEVSTASLRDIEPCGLLDREYLDELGTVAQLRPWGGFDTCSVELTDQPADQSVIPDQIDLELYSDLPAGLLQVAGSELLVDESFAPDCRVYFPLPDNAGHARVLTVMADGTACDVAETVAETALAGIDDSPRAGSAYDQPAAAIDPCSVADAVGLEVDTSTTSPYSCQFASGESIRIQLGTIASRAPVAIDAVQQGSRTFVTQQASRGCSVTYDIGDPVVGLPERNPTAAAFARIQPQLYVFADTCVDATGIATAAADELRI